MISNQETYTINLISKFQDFIHLADEWDELLASSTAGNIFLTSDWLITWWEVYGHEYQMHVVTIRDYRGILVAAAPFMIFKFNYPLLDYGFRSLRFIGCGEDATPEYLNIIVRKGYENDVIPLMIKTVAVNDDYNVIDLFPLANDNLGINNFSKIMPTYGFHFNIKIFSKCPIMNLPSNWSEHLENASKNFKKKSKEYLRVCHRDLNTFFQRVTDPRDLTAKMQQLIALHHNRWGNKTKAFRSERYLEFHHSLARRLIRKNFLRLHFLETPEEPIAAFYGFKYSNRYYFYQSGRNLDYAKYHVGFVLMNHCIQDAIDEGATVFDFLTGTEDYKNHWANDFNHSLRLSAYTNQNSWYLYRLIEIYQRLIGKNLKPERALL